MTSIVIEPQASLDIEEAASWYETQLIGLGVEFILAVLHQVRSDKTIKLRLL